MKKLICPKCQDEISFLTFAMAFFPLFFLPGYIKCPNCKSILKLGKYAVITILFALALFFGYLLTYYYIGHQLSFIPFILIFTLIWIVAHCVYFTLVRALGIELKLTEYNL